jgi:hypothetical protein
MIKKTIIQGDSIEISLSFKDAKTNMPINLTGCTCKIVFKDTAGVILETITTNIISDAINGLIYCIVPGILTDTMLPGTIFHSDLKIIYPSGSVKTYAKTEYTIEEAITHV